MAMDFSRRDFMKCAGVTVLAVASGSLLTGCGGSDAGVHYGVDKPVDIAAGAGKSGKATVTLKGYKDGWFTNLDALASKLTGTYANTKWITVSLKIENNTDGDILLGNTTEDKLKAVIASIMTGNFQPLTKLHNENFAITCTGGAVYFGAVGYSVTEDGNIDAYSETLAKGDSGFVKLYCVVPNNWGKMDILYTPPFNPGKKYTFTLTQADEKPDLK